MLTYPLPTLHTDPCDDSTRVHLGPNGTCSSFLVSTFRTWSPLSLPANHPLTLTGTSLASSTGQSPLQTLTFGRPHLQHALSIQYVYAHPDIRSTPHSPLFSGPLQTRTDCKGVLDASTTSSTIPTDYYPHCPTLLPIPQCTPLPMRFIAHDPRPR